MDIAAGTDCMACKSTGSRQLGHIQRNAQADILLFAHTDIHALFHTLGNRYLAQVIKKGIRFFPDILVS